MKIIAFIFFILISNTLLSQHNVLKGKVTDGITGEALENVTVYWQGTTIGTITTHKGIFNLHNQQGAKFLIFSMIGYKTDTVEITDKENFYEHKLFPDNTSLDEVRVQGNLDAAYISRKETILSSTITSAGLQKLACCNIGESFENDPSVDVDFTDALSGARQIQLLGLSGTYSQILIENIPAVRGLATPYGLSLIPGPWMESIQISKGTSSVINGFEAITGQINVELKKPDRSDLVLLNLYTNSHLRSEVNLLVSPLINQKWHSLFMAHGGYNNLIEDHNHDGFADNPQSKTINLMNRWKYSGHPLTAQLGVSVFGEERQGGQTAFLRQQNPNYYGIQVNNYQVSSFAKTAIEFHDLPETSLGIQAMHQFYRLESQFGNRHYNADQNSLYVNAIFQTIIINSNYQLSAGASFRYDEIIDRLADSTQTKLKIPGFFAQTTFSLMPSLTLMTGLRADYTEHDGILFTPRLHLRWGVDTAHVLRISAGKGYRYGNYMAENLSLLASSRQFSVKQLSGPEEAWNAGINFTSHLQFSNQQKITATFDYYHTWFNQQLIIDLYNSPQQVLIYPLNGKSFSDNLQGQIIYQPVEQFEINMAWRYTMVKTSYQGNIREKPLTSRNKGLVSTTYFTKWKKWKYDLTVQYNSKTRLPNTSSNPEPYGLKEWSPAYWMVFAQVTRNFKHLEIYAGVENLFGYTQPNPIVAADNPFGEYFDASIIWGPITGRMFYAGLRFKIH